VIFLENYIAMDNLTNRDWIIVTGAGSGIGFDVAQSLCEKGEGVIAFDCDNEKLNEAFRGSVGSVVYRCLDVRDAGVVSTSIDSLRGEVGAIKGLVNCAGVYPVTPFLDITVGEWDEVLNTNLRGAFIVSQAVARSMIAERIQGSIVNVTSTAATFCRPGVSHYGSSKAGLTQLTRDMALELAEFGIRVNAVAPGVIGTEKVLTAAKMQGAKEHAAKLASIPIGRIGKVSEITALIEFLLSDQASYCTGSVLLADGGLTLGIPRY
jgi:NAD(P)-dependent dehydrogenase (short-subunit alcohol dehydrogenase family)